MHPMLIYLAAVWMTVLLGVCAVRVVRAGALVDRILAADTAILILIALLVLFAHRDRSAYYLDAALALALLAFIGTLAAVRYRSEGKVLS